MGSYLYCAGSRDSRPAPRAGTNNNKNNNRIPPNLFNMTAGAEAVDINMNTEQEGVANQVMDEFLPEDLTDQQLGLSVPDAGVGRTDLEDEDQER